MNIRFTEMELKNFLSFQNLSIRFDTPGYTMIKGQNLNKADMSLSNGSGKSALFDGIFWILTGETIRGSKNVVNRYLTGGCYGILTFYIDDIEYRLLRAKDDDKYKSTLKLWKNNEDISGKGLRDTEVILMNEFPSLNSELLGSIIIFGQSLPHRFSNNTPSGRKEILESLSNTDFMIQDLKSRVTIRKTVLDSSIRQLEDQLLESKTRNSVLQEQLDSIASQLTSSNELENLEQIILEVQTEITQIDDRLTNLHQVSLQEEETIQECLNSIKQISEKEQQEKLSLQSTFDEVIQNLRLNLNTVSVKQTQLIQEKRKLDSITDICPTCKQKIPGVVKIDTSDIQQQIEELKVEKSSIEEEIDRKTLEYHQFIEDIKVKYSQLAQQYKDSIDQIQSEDTLIKIKDTEADKQSKTNQLNKLQNLLIQKDSLQQQLEDLKVQIEILDNKILYINNELEEQSHSREALQSINLLLSKEFRGYLLQHVIEYIQQKCNFYSQIVYNTQLITFSLEGNKISISYDNKEYELLSGGERQKLDLIIQFSIRDMLCKYLNFSCNILVLDEILDNLDDVGSTQILNLISTCLNDVESVFLISHRQDFIIPYDNEITIVKGDNKISTLV